MIVTTDAIVISKLKYRDNDLIVRCYTKQLGIVSFLLYGVLKSKKGKSKIAYFQLLSQLQISFNYKENKGLQSLQDVRVAHVYTSLHTQVLKSSIVMFLAEVLAAALKEEEPNPALYSFLENTLMWLDVHEQFANFHLLFLLKLTKYLGFYPDVSQIDDPYFNLMEGHFEPQETGKYSISGEQLNLLKTLLDISFENLPDIKINAKQRQNFLNLILLYFELHLGSFKTPKSLEILNQVFH
ncbi:DNA repair protein RecO [Gaetbulibacter aestuarii]|uniref:DNA repair protein RecO n=1 Tax=Gaetbulibacter aestuarii TaxID=1502358 RepID=A0ABW7MWB0_9FLAO